MPKVDPSEKSMDEIVALCKRRGFVYPASEIYGGINGFWDYGPLGALLKNNIRDHWWKRMVECPPIGPDGDPLQIVGLDSSIIQNPRTWEASGHVAGFNDPMSTCKQCKKLLRADHVLSMLHSAPWVTAVNETSPGTDGADNDTISAFAGSNRARKVAPGLVDALKENPSHVAIVANAAQRVAAGDQSETFVAACPHCGGELTEPRAFNLMFESHAGAIKDEANKVYLRPETAQGIFLNYKNVVDTMRVKVPFGVAQIGKAFRNEVTPRNFIFRSREFEQMEMEWFCHPDEAAKWYEFWKNERMDWWKSLGIDEANLRFRDHDDDELAHYSKMCVDVEYRYPFTGGNFGELEGIAHRGCFDLTQHQEHSGKDQSYFDQELQVRMQNEGKSKEEIKEASRYIPNVIEPASGLTRAVLVLLCEAFTPTPDRSGSKYVLSFKPKFAPIKAGIFPLVAKDGMPEVAQKLYYDLREKFTCEYDVKQSIGRRYARMDEIGTPYCFTIDGDTLTDQTVTVRERDTASQQRINISQVEAFLRENIG
ncbi:MAG: glycine--tRNA ligase [Phycisphaera sp.]|nr:glycine--tRNA ligase [Phycisphaera sp.]